MTRHGAIPVDISEVEEAEALAHVLVGLMANAGTLEERLRVFGLLTIHLGQVVELLARDVAAAQRSPNPVGRLAR